MLDEYFQWSATTGASFVPAWSNSDVSLVAFAIFAVFFTVSAFAQRPWMFDVAFLALVVGGILVAWPAMVAVSIGAVLLVTVVSFLHRAVAPRQSAAIEAEAERLSKPAVEAFARELRDRDGST